MDRLNRALRRAVAAEAAMLVVGAYTPVASAGRKRTAHTFRQRVVAALVLTVMVAACTPPAGEPSTSAPAADSSGDALATGSGAGEPGAPEHGQAVENLPIGTLSVSPSIAASGTTVTVDIGEGAIGEVTAVAPDGTRVTTAGDGTTAAIEIPLQAPAGEWAVIASGDRPALGTFQVATPAGLSLRTDRAHLRSDGAAEITLDALDPPDGASVVFGWGDLDWEDYFADATDTEPLGVLVPDAGGWLQPGADPVPLADIVGKQLVFAAVPAAGVQALVLSADGESLETSNVVKLESCDEAATISGSMAGPGWVHAVALGDRLRTAGIRVSSDSFTVNAPAGTVALFGSLDDGSTVRPVLVDAPCGSSIDVDMSTGVSISRSAETEAPDADGGPALDEGTLTLGGDREQSFRVLPICQYRRQEVGVVFAVEEDGLPTVSLMVPGGDTSGEYSAALEITDWTAGGQQSTGAVDVTIAYRPGSAIPYADIAVEGTYEGAAGSGTVYATFGCSVLGASPQAAAPSPSVAAPTEVVVSVPPPVTPFDTGGAGDPGAGPSCGTVVVDDADHASGPATAAMLRDRLSRADVVAVSELVAILDLVPASDVAVLARFVAAVQEQAPIVVESGEGGFSVGGADVGSDEAALVDLVASSAVCASGEAVGAEPIEIVVRVTDLADRPVAGGTVVIRSAAGTEVVSGPLVDGSFASEVESSAAGYGVTVDAGTPPPVSFKLAGRSAAQLLFGGYTILLDPEDDLPVPPGPMGMSIIGRNCAVPGAGWAAIVVLELGPYLSMMDMAAAVSSPFAVLAASGNPLQGIFAGLAEVFPQLAELPFAVEEARQIVNTAPNAYQPVLTGTTFEMPVPGRSVNLEINGATSGIRLTRSRTRPDLVRVTANGTWLFNARIEGRDSCPDNLDLLMLAPQLAPFR